MVETGPGGEGGDGCRGEGHPLKRQRGREMRGGHPLKWQRETRKGEGDRDLLQTYHRGCSCCNFGHFIFLI